MRSPSWPPARCPNCTAELRSEPVPRYCWQCGQETQLHEPTLFEFVHEFVGHYVAVEGTLWRTLGALIASPGKLTNEYFVGRRRRYVLPLRIYLTTSFLFFLVVKVFGSASSFHLAAVTALDSQGHRVTAQGNPAEYEAALLGLKACTDAPGSCSWAHRLDVELAAKALNVSDHPEVLARGIVSLAPYAVFVLLPLFAAIVMLAYRSRRLNYGGYFVFSLHTHAFWFLALTLLALAESHVARFGMVVLPVYAFWSLQRVYGGRWWTTLARCLLVTLLYVPALMAAVSLMGIVTLLQSH